MTIHPEHPERVDELRLHEMVLPTDDFLPTNGHVPTFGDKAYDYWVQGVQEFIDIFPFRRQRVTRLAKRFHELRIGECVSEMGITSKVYDAGYYRKLRLTELKRGVGDTVVSSATTVACNIYRPDDLGAHRTEVHKNGSGIERITEAVYPFVPGQHPLELRWMQQAIDQAHLLQHSEPEQRS